MFALLLILSIYIIKTRFVKYVNIDRLDKLAILQLNKKLYNSNL